MLVMYHNCTDAKRDQDFLAATRDHAFSCSMRAPVCIIGSINPTPSAMRQSPVRAKATLIATQRRMREQVTGFNAAGRSLESRQRRGFPPESEAISPALSAGSHPAPEFE